MRLSVRDTGAGIPAEMIAHIFEPFFTTKSFGQNSGLGLATVYGIVRQNGGHIEVSSAPGAGTVFTLLFPRYGGTPESLRAAHAAAPAPQGRETILLVEDERDVLRMVARMLSRHGYTVLQAATPSEALRVAREHPGAIDLLLSDIVLPEMSGYELAEALAPSRPRMRRLFMSGHAFDTMPEAGGASPPCGFIEKPFTIKALADRIRETLDAPRS